MEHVAPINIALDPRPVAPMGGADFRDRIQLLAQQVQTNRTAKHPDADQDKYLADFESLRDLLLSRADPAASSCAREAARRAQMQAVMAQMRIERKAEEQEEVRCAMDLDANSFKTLQKYVDDSDGVVLPVLAMTFRDGSELAADWDADIFDVVAAYVAKADGDRFPALLVEYRDCLKCVKEERRKKRKLDIQELEEKHVRKFGSSYYMDQRTGLSPEGAIFAHQQKILENPNFDQKLHVDE